MASKQAKDSEVDVEELLDTVDKTMDRLKTLYEQYFLGIQKQAPTFIHNDMERKLRDLAQMQLRNTGLRYRLATLQQKFGSYNSYWRRTLRQMENGTYARQLSKVGREAARSGAEIPEEILAAMPKRMRDQVLRDREQALAIARRHQQHTDDLIPPEVDEDFVAMIKEPTEVRRKLKGTDGSHLLDGTDADFDIDAFFAEVEQREDTPVARSRGTTRQPANRGRTPTGRRAHPTSNHDALRGLPPVEPGMRTIPSHGGQSRSATAGEPTTAPVPPAKPGTPPPPPRASTQGMQPLPRAGTADPTRSAPGMQPMPRAPTGDPTQGMQPLARPGTPPARPGSAPGSTQAIPRTGGTPPPVPGRSTGAQPAISASGESGSGTPAPVAPSEPSGRAASAIPSQMSRPNPIAPGSAAARGAVPVESMSGPFPRNLQTGAIPTIPMTGAIPKIPMKTATPSAGIPAIPKPPIPTGAIPTIPKPTGATPPVAKAEPPIVTRTPPAGVPAVNREPGRTPATGVPVRPAPSARPAAAAPQRPPPGMTDADVNALYAKYVKAKEMVGEKIGPGEHSKLLKTINSQAPKIMEQYKAKGVDFSVVVKDNQVIIRAKPKT